jgi:large conductance mechanosensitive channel
MNSVFKEFKEFVNKGNVIELAVGVVIGGAFGKIVTSLVNDIIMPPIGALDRTDLSGLFISLNGTFYQTIKQAKDAGAPTLNYGLFLNSILDFIIVSTSIFLLTRAFIRFQKRQIEAENADKICSYCMSKISIKATRCPQCTSILEETH